MLKILDYAHHLMSKAINQGETAIDATCGNGNDTIKLSEIVGENGKVLAFDIQQQAIKNTKKRLAEQGISNVEVIHDSHANVEEHLNPEDRIGGAIFNLGYLPKGDKTVITEATTTIEAIDNILTYLKENGIVVVVIYHGHPGGETEKDAVIDYTTSLDQKSYHVLRYEFINQKNNPPFVIAIEKR
ncbi:class I SAM-dependent methyltransferase [Ornithinibacillus halophilus]|uniref:Putative rRNA methylase n=1 Tax=Ornithinibacillus halophilus TaxID=930117 RepID=A0A1M5NBQ7_9BACI|nr:class I SAM-dependent methyltransferase [Ornithinibacillus halophilus]SHG86931.1 Putative rRNA methylase [Ornithinibacillus halophilus]